MILPHYRDAVIPETKIFDYALNMKHPKGRDKAIAFHRALGYNQSNGDALIAAIRQVLPIMHVVERAGIYGRQFCGVTELTGVNGKTAKVRTCWQIDRGTNIPKLTSIYVDQ